MRPLLGTFDARCPEGPALDDVVRRALEEDRAFDDRSTRPLPGAEKAHAAEVVAREGGVLAGVPLFARAFELVAGKPVPVSGRADGDAFEAGDVVLRVTAPGGVLLAGERTGLNFLQRLSGIATVTRRCVDAVAGRIAVCDTRKTTPGLRALEKWAVIVGGGRSHRWGLGDMVMLKENHLVLAGGIGPAVAAIRADAVSGALPLTVEVRSFDEAMEAAALGVDRILLDNLPAAEMRRIAGALGTDRPELEASGGLRPEALAEVAATGVDLVSLGSLTHSVRAIDLSFLIEGA
jgi:nicotinate-nucleotide pyrophosphorylase (carboxylating)